MEPTRIVKTDKNELIHHLIGQAANSNTAEIRQLKGEQRKILLKIINNTDNVFSNYEMGKDKKLDDHLYSIKITLEGKLPRRSESKGANFMRALKNWLGRRTSTNKLHQALNDPQATYRKYLALDSQKYQARDFQTLLPKEFFTPEIIQKLEELPEETKKLIATLMSEYLTLSHKNILATTPLADPIYTPLMDAFIKLSFHIGDESSPVDKNLKPLLLALTNYVIPINSQRPFLAIFDPKVGQGMRLEATQAFHKESHPVGSLERKWAEEGFIEPFRGLNLWEKFSLTSQGDDQFVLTLESRVNDQGNEKGRIANISLDLRPFRPSGEVPLTDKEKQKLLKFLSRDTPYPRDYETRTSFTRLSSDQKKLLMNTHTALCHEVTDSLMHLYHRS